MLRSFVQIGVGAFLFLVFLYSWRVELISIEDHCEIF